MRHVCACSRAGYAALCCIQLHKLQVYLHDPVISASLQTALNAALMLMIKEQLHTLVKSGLDAAITEAHALTAGGLKRHSADGRGRVPSLNMRALLLGAGKP